MNTRADRPARHAHIVPRLSPSRYPAPRSAHLSDHPEVKGAIQRASEVGLSAVSIGELRAGFLKGGRSRRNEELLRSFLASPRVRVLSVDEETASRYAAIHDHLRRQGTPIPINDISIAATAAHHGLRIITLDRHVLGVPQVPVDFVESAGPES